MSPGLAREPINRAIRAFRNATPRMKILLDLRYRIEYVFLRLIIGIVRLFPLDRAADISAAIWRRMAPGGRRHKRAIANLTTAFPEKPREELEEIALNMWDNLGRVMAEMMQIDRILDEPERLELVDDYVVRRYDGKMGTGICVSLHMGNWELAAWPLVLCEAQPAAVYRLVKNPYVELYLRRMRERLYPGGLFASKGMRRTPAAHESVRIMTDFARKGGRLAFLADRYDGKGIAVPFFGQEAKSTPFPAMLARRLGARMWIGCCRRVGRESRFRVEVVEVKVPRTENSDEDVRWLTAAVQQQFEKWIRETPEQFMWTNRRFS